MKKEEEERFKALDGGLLWECEFCGHLNSVKMEDEEIPPRGEQSVDY